MQLLITNCDSQWPSRGLLSRLLDKIRFVDKMNASEYFDDRKDFTNGVFANDGHDDVEA